MIIMIDALSGLYEILAKGEKPPALLMAQMTNIYPIWDRWINLLEFDILPLFIGTGFGSSSFINNAYMGFQSNQLLNPQANIIRLIYENGFIGCLLFISAFIYPINQLRLPVRVKNKIIISMFFLMGAFLSHRSPTLYIYLGVSLVVLNNYSFLQ